MDIHGRPSNTMQSMVIHGHHFAGVVWRAVLESLRSRFASAVGWATGSDLALLEVELVTYEVEHLFKWFGVQF